MNEVNGEEEKGKRKTGERKNEILKIQSMEEKKDGMKLNLENNKTLNMKIKLTKDG